MYSTKDLEDTIRQIGVKADDLLTVHLSLKSVGKIDDTEKSGAEVFIDALRNCVPDGLLMIPAHTFKNIGKEPRFDIRNTMPCIGAVPCEAVKKANTAYDAGDKTCVRSMHVSHSVVAFGKEAYDFVLHDRHSRTRLPMQGCYGELYRRSGKILLVGVNLTNNTFIHMADEYFFYESSGKSPEASSLVYITDYDGSQWEQERLITVGPDSETFSRYEEALQRAGAINYGKIGDAKAMLVDARKCFDIVVDTHQNEKHI